MIKIIISLTWDGFAPRFASDGILDDAVTRSIIDSRGILAFDLNKSGYSFQPLSGKGILFHKTITIFDGFQRDGCMMASIFLPQDTMLDGRIIKDALDNLVSNYEYRITNRKASLNVDWSFVTSKANELNGLARTMTWKKRPTGAGGSLAALVRGADSMVADFFHYPNPLHKGFNGFEQVFLSEGFLNPKRANVEQGFKVLNIEDVDINNPIYTIEYQNAQDADLSGLVKEVSRKDLMAASGDFPCGTVTKKGYHNSSVFIKADEKVSQDGFCVKATIPTLVIKQGKVQMTIKNDQGREVRIGECSVYWNSSVAKNDMQRVAFDGCFSFEGSECGVTWNYTVRHDSYVDYTGSVFVDDSKDPVSIEVTLRPQPLWTIYILFPAGTKEPHLQGVKEKDLQESIRKAKEYVKDKDLVVDESKCTQDTTSNTYVIAARKRDQRDAFDTDNPAGSGGQGQTTNDTGKKEPEKETYYLCLDEKSRKYPLFKNFRKKLALKKIIDKRIEKLDNEIKSLKGTLKGNTASKQSQEKLLDDFFTLFEDYEQKNITENAKSKLEDVVEKIKSDSKDSFLNLSNKLLKDINKYHSFPDIIRKSKDFNDYPLSYDFENHRIITEATSQPIQVDFSFYRDWFRYSIPSQNWVKGNFGTTSIVRKTMNGAYWCRKIIPFVLTAVVLGIAAFFLWPKDKPQPVPKELLAELEYNINELSVKCYCGDSILDSALRLDTKCLGWPDASKDTAYNNRHTYFDKLKREQQEKKEKDSSYFASLNLQLDSFYWPSFNLTKYDDTIKVAKEYMTESHKEEIENRYKSLNICNNVRLLSLVDTAKNENNEIGTRKSACYEYLYFYPVNKNGVGEGSNSVKMQGILDRLNGKTTTTSIRNSGNDADKPSAGSSPKNEQTGNVTGNQPSAATDNINGRRTSSEKHNLPVDANSVYDLLTWDNVKDDGKNLNNRYDVSGSTYKDNVNKIITKANQKGQKSYNDARKKVDDNKKNNDNKLTLLKKELGIK